MKKRKYVLICFLLLFIPNLNSAKIAFKSLRDGVSNLYIMDDDGSNVQRITFTERPLWDSHPRWSPNGKRIMFMRDISKTDGDQLEIFIMDSNGKHEERITHNAALDGTATWAPDGQNITFTSDRSGSFEIHRMNILTKKVHQLTRNPGLREFAASSSWAPNGRYIAYEQIAPFRFRTIYVMDADGAKPHPLIPSDDTSRYSPCWSPDSSSIMYIEVAHEVVNAEGHFRWKSSNVVIQKYRTKERRILKTPEEWVIHSISWMDDGRQVLIAAEEHADLDSQIDIYRFDLTTGEITNLTNHPADDYSMDWISDNLFPVTPLGKKKTQWGKVKK